MMTLMSWRLIEISKTLRNSHFQGREKNNYHAADTVEARNDFFPHAHDIINANYPKHIKEAFMCFESCGKKGLRGINVDVLQIDIKK